MNDSKKNQWEVEIENLIQELVEYEVLSGDLQEEVESLLEDGLHDEAGKLAVKNCSRTNALAD